MALLDFPSSGLVANVTQYSLNGNTWQWNGTSWVAYNNLSLSSQVSGILAVQYGGTGFGGTYNKGDILYALSSNTFAKLSAGTAGSVLSIDASQNLYWKVDDTGAGTVGSGTIGGFAYYNNSTTAITSGSGFSYISTPNNVIIKNGTLSLIGSTIDSGTWAGSAVTAKYGGTGLAALSTGDIIYGSATDTYSRLSHPGAGYALTTVASTVAWITFANMSVGSASKHDVTAIANATTYYLVGTTASSTSSSITPYTSGTAVTFDNNSVTATTFRGNALTAGTATSAVRAGVIDLLAISNNTTYYLTGSTSSSSSNSQAQYTSGTAVTFDNNSVTATTFRGNALTAGTATSAVRAGVIDLLAISNNTTYYFTGSTSSSASNSQTQYTSGTAVTFDNNSVTATTFRGNALTAGTATSAVRAGVIDLIAISNNTTYYLTGSTSSSSSNSQTQYTSGTAVTFDNNSVTATTFRGNALTAGTATSAVRAGVLDLLAISNNTTYYLTGTTSSSASNSQAQYTSGTAVTFDNSSVTATTFRGTATKATNIVGGTASAGSSIVIQTGVDTTGFLVHPAAAGYALTTTSSGLVYGALSSIAVTTLSAGNGINVSGPTGNVTVSNIGVTSVTGTVNQISVSSSLGSSNGAITLSLPQSISTTSSPTFTDITINGGTSSTLTSVGSNPTSMVNKQYVDNLASGLDVHASVRLVLNTAIGASYYQLGYGIGNTATGAYLTSIGNATFPAIDGVTIGSTGVNQRVLITGGLTGAGKTSINGSPLVTPADSNLVNGIYYVGSVGSGSSQWYLYRATDTDDNTELTGGTFAFVEEGNTYKDSAWVCTNDTTNLGPIQFGSTAITFTQFAGAAAFTSGQGLTKVGNTFATNINLSPTGVASGIGYSQFNIGGPSVGGVADTGYYPTFSVRTSGTTVAGSALLTLNSTGFSLTGSTNTPATLTITGDISVPNPGGTGRIPYSSDSNTLTFLTNPGSGYALTSVGTNSVAWITFANMSVGSASLSTRSNTFDTTSISANTTYYLVGSTAQNGTTGITPYTSGSGVTFDNSSVTATTFRGNATTAGTATSAVRAGVIDLLAISNNTTYYLTGSASNVAANSQTQYTSGSGVTFDNSSVTATTFRGNATTAGTATSAVRAGVLDLLAISNNTTYYLTGTTSSSASNSQAQYTSGSGVTFDNNSVTATTFRGNATTASLSTRSNTFDTTSISANTTYYFVGSTSQNGTTGITPYTSGSGVTFDNSSVTATTFRGNATTAGTATSAVRAGVIDLLAISNNTTYYLTGSASNVAANSQTQYTSGSGVTFDNSSVTATTFRGNATTAGTATSAVRAGVIDLLAISNNTTYYLTGSASNVAANSQTQYTSGSGVTFDNSSVTATTFRGNATSATNSTNSTNVNVNNTSSAGSSYLAFVSATSGNLPILVNSGMTVDANSRTITAVSFSGTATTATRVGITTSVSTSDLPIVFATDHQPSAGLASSTLLTYQASTGKITNGIWAGTAITTGRGGTGLITVNPNQVLMGAATGNTWAGVASTNVPVVAISDSPPAQPGGAIGATQAGQLWWDSYFGVLKVYYVDATPTAQWVDATPVLGSSGGGSSTKRSYVMTFGAGFTPSTGADTVQIQIPYAPDNSSKYYYIKRLDYRNETVSSGAGVSFYIERFTGGAGAFNIATSGNRIHSGSGLSFVAAAGIYITSYTLSSTGASFVSSAGVAASIISGDYLRLNFAAINSAATLSVSMVIEEQ